MALFNIKNFIKQSRDMKSQSIFFFKFYIRNHLLICEPSAVRKCVFKFVPVHVNPGRSNNRANLRQFDLSDSRQSIHDLFFLKLKLEPVWQMLPLTTTTNSEMDTPGLNPVRRVFMKLYHSSFQIFLSFFYNPD